MGGRGSGRLRIIAGRFRGRVLPIPDEPGLRPTGDRVRETLFNWLAPVIEGARCLDAFAGSGALGLEAVSRGAGSVTLIERSEPVARQLELNVRTLRAEQVQVIRSDALTWLARPAPHESFDLIFLDPPFGHDLLAPACDLLCAGNWLAPNARVYLETSAHQELPTLPASWEILRERTTGAVRYALAQISD